MGDDFHQMTARIVEIDATAPVQMIDLAGFAAPRIGVIPGAQSAYAGERRVELGIADEESIVPRPEFFAGSEIEGHPVSCLERDEIAPFRPRLEIEDIGEELGRFPFV